MNLHEHIYEKLDYFIKNKKIPNILFYGYHGSGKRTILRNFLKKIYNSDHEKINKNILSVDCGQGLGIKFIREELKFFSKTSVLTEKSSFFKSVVLLNADKLTIDAQSALRRCIELFNHSTRFFVIVNDKSKLLKPILSRLCSIYVEPKGEGDINKNLHSNEFIMLEKHDYFLKRTVKFNNKIKKFLREENTSSILMAEELYNLGYSGIDFINYLEKNSKLENKYEIIIEINKFSKQFRNEKIIILFILDILSFRCKCNLRNLDVM